MLKLSVLYEHGLGVEADLVEAYRWAWLAHAAGQMELREQVHYQAIVSSDPKSLEPVWRITDPAFESLSEAQEEEAMRRPREWRPTTAKQ